MKKLVVLMCCLLVLCSCLPITPPPPFDYIAYYSGQWELVNTYYVDSCSPDSNMKIILYDDTTFVSTFSYFWDQDSSRQDSLSGTWEWEKVLEPHYIVHYLINLSVNDGTISFNIQLSGIDSSKTMIWGEPDYGGRMQYEWRYIGEANLSTDE